MLEFRKVTVKNKKKTIIDEMTLQLPDGIILGLLGPDIEAREAFLKVAAGLLPPGSGTIRLDGSLISLPQNEAHMNLSYMAKEYGFDEMLSVEEYFDLYLSLYRVNGRYRERRIEEVLELTDLVEYRNRFIADIPTEQYPFLYLGKSVLFEPKWLIIDEPFLNVTQKTRSRMVEIFTKLQESGMSIIINTRQFFETQELFSDIVVFRDARVSLFGPYLEVLEQTMSRKTIRMQILKGLDDSLRVLKNNSLVERVVVDGPNVIFLFAGEDEEEAVLLSDLVYCGALIKSFKSDPVSEEWFLER